MRGICQLYRYSDRYTLSKQGITLSWYRMSWRFPTTPARRAQFWQNFLILFQFYSSRGVTRVLQYFPSRNCALLKDGSGIRRRIIGSLFSLVENDGSSTVSKFPEHNYLTLFYVKITQLIFPIRERKARERK